MLMTQGKVARAYLGVVGGMRPIHRRIVRHYGLPVEIGVEVVAVSDKGPAHSAGVLAGDVILQIGERPVTSVDDLHRFLTDWPAGQTVVVKLLRGTGIVELRVTPVEAG